MQPIGSTTTRYFLVSLLAIVLWWSVNTVQAANIAYIHGDVSRFGDIPSGALAPFDQMLLSDSGDKGLSQFKQLVEGESHSISQHYDAATNLTASFLINFDVVIFGLHQKLWSTIEKNTLDIWIKGGGGMFIYSDSASGGCFCEVGAQNPIGQSRTNNLIAQYGLQVTVDQADGTFDFTAVAAPSNILIAGQHRLEGEGVSPVAVAANSDIEILIPFTRNPRFTQGITIDNPVYAALALKTLQEGHIAVMFDRQPMWNSGPGSNLNRLDNREILRRLINFLAASPDNDDDGGGGVTPPPPAVSPNGFSIVGAIMLLLD